MFLCRADGEPGIDQDGPGARSLQGPLDLAGEDDTPGLLLSHRLDQQAHRGERECDELLLALGRGYGNEGHLDGTVAKRGAVG
ncbi:hypothetical protein ACFPZI_04965 [Streptomyces chlorus]|uniref:Uncharacterized protein n=1 Tax=Streptomyces chlorus TaxID=887452 RepID=A0ABW1DRC5_9ACTN